MMKKTIYLFSKIFFYGFVLFSIVMTLCSVLAVLEYNEIAEFSFITFEGFGKANFQFLNIKFPLIEVVVQLRFGLILIFIISALFFYAYYFYALKEFFKIFIRERVFNEKSLKRLKKFYNLNYFPAFVFFGRPLYSVIHSESFDGELLIISTIHILLALLLYYYMDIVAKGTKVQQENDLTI